MEIISFVPFIVLITRKQYNIRKGSYYGKDLWNKSILESSIQKRKTPENKNSIDVHLCFLPVYNACLDVFRLHCKRILIIYKKGGNNYEEQN